VEEAMEEANLEANRYIL